VSVLILRRVKSLPGLVGDVSILMLEGVVLLVVIVVAV